MKIDSVKYKAFKGSSWRFDPSFHLSEANKVFKTLKRSPYALTDINNCSERVFLGNIFSRVFVKDSSHGIPYLAASDTVLSNIDTGAFLSKKQVEALSYLKLEKDWILVTCSGTVGNVTYTNKCFENHIATHDLIRIVPSDKTVRRGCLYAYLSSKYGHCLLTQSEFGGVVKHINDDHVKDIPIPQFPVKFQEKVDNLVKESAQLREEATASLNKAKKMLNKVLRIPEFRKKNSKVSFKDVFSSYTRRLEAAYYVGENRSALDFISNEFKCVTLETCTESIFRPGIFKREYVKNGVTFLGGADVMMAIPTSEKQLSKRQVENMPELQLKRNWILATCGGTIGNVVFVDNQLEKCAVSQHVIRIVPKKNMKAGYLFAYLNSDIGYKLINEFAFGSVIPQVEPHHLKRIPVPIVSEKNIDEIDNLVQDYVKKNEVAKQKELQAISLIEKEIDGWNA